MVMRREEVLEPLLLLFGRDDERLRRCLPVFGSWMTLWTIESVTIVKLPVLRAAGRVALRLEKYEP